VILAKFGFNGPRSVVQRRRTCVALAIGLLATVTGAAPARAQTYSESLVCSCEPWLNAALILDAEGNLYTTTVAGGDFGIGTVIQVDAAGTQTTLYSFSETGFRQAAGGSNPRADLIRDPAGNFYSTTFGGGASGAGVVFKLDPAGNESVLYSFTGGADGANPVGGVIADPAGNLYGTTYRGGSSSAGVVFKLDPAGNETVLHSFTGGADGGQPAAGVIRDSAGNLYGTTERGGGSNSGVVFKLDAAGNETVLHSFRGGADGAQPAAGVIQDSAGNLYGTTQGGGGTGFGTVFKVDTAGHETVLHSFTGAPSDGAYPSAGLLLGPAGNLYGTTTAGGSGRDGAGGGLEGGVVFEVDTAGHETVLHDFIGGPTDASNHKAALVRDSAGNLYGTTWYGGGSNQGAIFQLKPQR